MVLLASGGFDGSPCLPCRACSREQSVFDACTRQKMWSFLIGLSRLCSGHFGSLLLSLKSSP